MEKQMKSIISRIVDYFNGKKISEQYPKWEKSLVQLQKRLDYSFHDPTLLHAALLTNPISGDVTTTTRCHLPLSAWNFGRFDPGLHSKQRALFPPSDEQEGKLSKLKSKIVSETYLTLKANALDLGKYVLLSPEEQQSGGAAKASILSDTMEAMICAIYLDSGIAAAGRFIRQHILVDYETTVTRDELVNYKSILQEYMQSKNQEPPRYITIAEEGPEHNKTFVVEVRLGNKLLGTGKGSTKKNAHQEAARLACQKLGV
jgi:ribonuclease-3